MNGPNHLTRGTPGRANHLRLLGWLLLAGSVGALVWASQLFEQAQRLRPELGRLQGQVVQTQVRLRDAAAQAQQAVPQQAAQDAQAVELKKLDNLLLATKGWGSDARNATALLERVKQLCTGAGLTVCNVRRSAPASAVKVDGGQSDGREFTPYTFNVTGSFEAVGVLKFFTELDKLGSVYKVEKVNITQNRAEWELSFFVLSPAAPVSADPKPAQGGVR